MSGRVLLIDDDRSMCEMLSSGLQRRGFTCAWRTNGDEALQVFRDEDFDVVLTDVNMRGLSGLQVCERVVSDRPDVPVVLITAFGSLESAIAGIRAGAYDFITKPVELDALALALRRAVQHRALREEVKRLRQEVASQHRRFDLVGASRPMAELYDLVQRVAPTDASVLITGESGTGKELVARALHAGSQRSAGPFVPINCGAMPENLLESELFGHVKGAFTDAKASRPGLFVRASGGTLFLDEIGDMPLSLQVKLLRVLQQRTVRPVGGDAEVQIDVRVVTATHRDLQAEIGAGRFREDLYYRIDVVHLEVPPLRSRGGDILLLAGSFLTEFAKRSDKRVTGISEGAARKLLAYAWPGNVRELQNCIERAVALTRHEQLMVEDLPARIGAAEARPELVVAYDDPSDLLPLEEVERRHILKVLEAVDGNKRLAARILGLDRKTLYRKLERWGVDAPDPEPG